MGRHEGWTETPEIGTVWTMCCGPYSIDYHVVDVWPDGTVIMEDDDHEVRIVDQPDGTSLIQEWINEEWVTFEDQECLDL